MCQSQEHGGRRCGTLAHTREQGNQARSAAKEAESESANAVKAARDGDEAGATRAALRSYAAFQRAHQAQAKAHEAAKSASSDRARLMSEGSARRATVLAARAARFAKSAQAAAKSASAGTVKGANRLVLGSEEAQRRYPCGGCKNQGKVPHYDEDDNLQGESDLLMCSSNGYILAGTDPDMGGPGDPALLAVPDAAPEPVPLLNLDVARLLPVLPSLEGDTETAAVATLLRAQCLGQVVCWTMDAWERGTPEGRGTPDYERELLGKWCEWVQTLLAPTDAAWWLENARAGAGGAIHLAVAAAAARIAKST